MTYSFYLDSTSTHSYMKYLYKYPKSAFPYADPVETSRKRNRIDFEYELLVSCLSRKWTFGRGLIITTRKPRSRRTARLLDATTRPRTTCCERWSVAVCADWPVRLVGRCPPERRTTSAPETTCKCGNAWVILATQSSFPQAFSMNSSGRIWSICCEIPIAWRKPCVEQRMDVDFLKN